MQLVDDFVEPLNVEQFGQVPVCMFLDRDPITAHEQLCVHGHFDAALELRIDSSESPVSQDLI